MYSKNKTPMTEDERAHIGVLKRMNCGCCTDPSTEAAPSETHEIEQGLWWTSVPLCASCHRGPLLGIHGQKRAWIIRGKTELGVLNETVCKLLTARAR